jgi:hypothetical protein
MLVARTVEMHLPVFVRRKLLGIGMVAGYSLLVAVYFYPVVFGGQSLLASPATPGTLPTGPYGSDSLREKMPKSGWVIDRGSSAWAAEPWTALVGRMYREGEIPFWNPYSGFGMPLAGNMQSGAFFPLRLPLFLRPSPTVWNAYLLFRFVVMGVFTYRFLRLWAVSPLNSFAGSLAFMFSGHFVLYANMWHLDVEMLLPLAMVRAERLIRTRAWRVSAGLGLVLALSILGGSPESTLLLWLFVGAYYAFRLVTIAARSDDRVRVASGYASRFALSVGVGVAAASPLLVLASEYVEQAYAPSHQAGGKAGLWGSPLSGAVSLVVPYLFGQLSNPIVPELNAHSLTPYLGAVPVMLSLLAPARRMTWFFGSYAVVSVLKAYAVPGINLLGELPILERVIFFKYNQPEVAFCVAVLAAISLDRLSTSRASGLRTWRVWLAAGLLIATIAGFLAFHDHAIVKASRERWVLSQVGLAVAIIGILTVLLLSASRRRRVDRITNVGCVALLMVEMFVYVPKHFPPRMDAFAVAPFVGFLKGDGDVFRIYGLDDTLYPNTNVVYKLSDIRALDALYPDRYLKLVEKSLNPGARDRFTGGSLGDMLRSQTVVDLMNVKYVVSLAPLGDDSLIDAVLRDGERHGPRDYVGKARYSIDGDVKNVLFLHPPAQVTYRLRVPDEGTVLHFSVGMDPAIWHPTKGDGVRYRMELLVDGRAHTVFDRYIDPKNRPEDRRWHEASVDLMAYRGQTVGMVLVAEPGQGNAFDWGGWGDLRADRSAMLWQEVYKREVRIYRNERALPRAYVVHEAKVVSDEQAALAKVTAPEFDPRRTAILEEPLAQERPMSSPGSVTNEPVRIEQYTPHRVVIEATLDAPGLLILSDTFYPGWAATVDGRAAKIYRANFLFRAVHLDPGAHRVEFRYHAPLRFYLALVVSMLTLAGAVAVVWHGRRSDK